MTTITFGGGPSLEQRRQFAGLQDGSHVPGYRGYCPQIKYRVGKTYGQDTHELQDVFKYRNIQASIAPDTGKISLRNILPSPTGDNKYTKNMVPGYTGYVPRRPYKFGGTYKEDCDVCIDEHLTNMKSFVNKSSDLRQSVRVLPSLQPIQRDPSVRDRMNLYKDTHTTQPLMIDDKRALTEPPMPGYQGYIPRIHTTELGLGCRYHQMTKNGLEAFKAESDSRTARQMAPVSLSRSPQVLGGSGPQRLYKIDGMIPKYTGYVPQRRYQFGQTYGDTTRSLDVCAHTNASFGEYSKMAQSIGS